MSLRASNFSEETIEVGKEEAGTSDFSQVYEKLQAKEDKAQKKAAPGDVVTEGSWKDHLMEAHHDHLYSHPKTFLPKSGYITLLL